MQPAYNIINAVLIHKQYVTNSYNMPTHIYICRLTFIYVTNIYIMPTHIYIIMSLTFIQVIKNIFKKITM